jgi:hypothetical protein
MPGKNEAEFKALANWMKATASEKKPDMSKCWKCGAPRFEKKAKDGDDREIKASRVDYLLGIGDRYCWVECKSGEESFAWADDENGSGTGIRTGQRVWMNDYTERGVTSWIFLTLGPGPAPKKREAWLIRWENWLIIEGVLQQQEMKSIPWQVNRMHSSVTNVHDCFKEYQLIWLANIGWVMPEGHPMTKVLPVENKYMALDLPEDVSIAPKKEVKSVSTALVNLF